MSGWRSRRCSNDVRGCSRVNFFFGCSASSRMAHTRESTAESVGPFGVSWSSFLPFSSSALASLPENTPRPSRYTRQDDQVQNYSAIPPAVRVPRNVPTAVKVEGKVWFANERSLSPSLSTCPLLIFFLAWLSWLNAAILIATFAVALFNASRDPVARAFAYVYAALSVCILVRLHPFRASISHNFSGLRLLPLSVPHHHDSQA